MSQILSHPFRVMGNGSVATVEQTSDEAGGEQLAVLVTTIAGERPLSPGFGITDPVFGVLHPSEVLAGIAEYGPPVEVVDINVGWDSDSTQLVTIDFD